jgi:tetratricopeptide (TPR) repeat protein
VRDNSSALAHNAHMRSAGEVSRAFVDLTPPGDPEPFDTRVCICASGGSLHVCIVLLCRDSLSMLLGTAHPPELTEMGAKAIGFFEQFRQKSDLEAANKCINLYGELLADDLGDGAYVYESPGQNELKHANGANGLPDWRHHILIQLSRVLQERFLYMGDRPDLDLALKRSLEALEICEAKGVLCPTVLLFRASALDANASETANSEDRHLAELCCREAISVCQDGTALQSTGQHTLAWIIYHRFEVTGTREYIDEAIVLQQAALLGIPASHTYDKHRHLRYLGACLRTRHDYFGDPSDQDESISALSEAAALCPLTHVDRYTIVLSAINVLHNEFYRSGDIKALDRALDLGRQALDGWRSESRLRPHVLHCVALNHLLRYNSDAPTAHDIEEAISLYREALRCSPNFGRRWIMFGNLADALMALFHRNGDLGNLEEAAQLNRHAIDAMPQDHPEHFRMLSNLADTLSLRFAETGDINDLNEALDLGQRAMKMILPSHMDYPHPTLITISHLCTRFEILQHMDDLYEAVSLSEELLSTYPEGLPRRDDIVYHLSKALLLRGRYTGNLDDISRVVEKLTSIKDQALSKMRDGVDCVRALAAAHLIRFRMARDAEDAVHAQTILSELLSAILPGRRDRFQCLIDAVELYLEHGTPYRSPSISLQHFAEALADNYRDVRSKIRGAKHLLDLIETNYKDMYSAGDPVSAQLLDTYASTIALLPRVAFFGLHLHSRLQSLTAGQRIALTGASHALNLSLPERAVEILEQGRATFWTHTLRLRSAFDAVPDEYSKRLGVLAQQLDKVSDSSDEDQNTQTLEREAARRRQQSDQFNSLVEQVRTLPGLERFLLHDQYSTLGKAAERGPVVVLISSPLACHAVVLQPLGQAIGIHLDKIAESWLNDKSAIWQSAVTEARSVLEDDRKLVKKAPRASDSRAKDILRSLWTDVVWPVFERLGLEVRSL